MKYFLLFLLIGVSSALPAQETAPPTGPGQSAVGEEDFGQLFGQWKQLLTKLRQLQGSYAQASDSEKPKLQEEFNGLLDEGKKLAPRLKASAEKAYVAATAKNQELSDFMHTVLSESFSKHDYDETARLAKLLLAHGEEPKTLHEMAAASLYATNDYAGALEHLQAAAKAGPPSSNIGEFFGIPEGAPAAQMILGKIKAEQTKWEKEKKIRAAEANADLPRVKFETTKGPIVIELFENEAPNTVANFVSLVERGYYNGLTFHRVIAHFMAQGGDPEGTGGGGPGYTIPDETDRPDHREHFRGSLSMAKTEAPNSGGSQFFLTFVPTPHLDGKHTVFGRVIEGFDAVGKLQIRDPEQPGAKADKIVKATVIRKRNHPYTPKTLAER